MKNESSCLGWAGVELPEVGTVDEEQAHHRAVQQEHTGDVEIRRVAQT